MTDPSVELDYFFDPFCGWCYASAPALAALAKVYPEALALRPSGLFADAGAQPMAAIAEHAWRNDTRIAALTGQRFSADYRDRVLRDPAGRFDSTHATRAIVALGELDARLEPVLLHALQTARYVDAVDTAKAEVVATVAGAVVRSLGHAVDEPSFADRLVHDDALAARTDGRIGDAVSRIEALPSAGVPQLLVTAGDRREVVRGADLHGGAAAVLGAVRRIVARAPALASRPQERKQP